MPRAARASPGANRLPVSTEAATTSAARSARVGRGAGVLTRRILLSAGDSLGPGTPVQCHPERVTDGIRHAEDAAEVAGAVDRCGTARTVAAARSLGLDSGAAAQGGAQGAEHLDAVPAQRAHEQRHPEGLVNAALRAAVLAAQAGLPEVVVAQRAHPAELTDRGVVARLVHVGPAGERVGVVGEARDRDAPHARALAQLGGPAAVLAVVAVETGHLAEELERRDLALVGAAARHQLAQQDGVVVAGRPQAAVPGEIELAVDRRGHRHALASRRAQPAVEVRLVPDRPDVDLRELAPGGLGEAAELP